MNEPGHAPARVSRRKWEHYLRGPESAGLDLTCVDACILYAVGTWMDDDGSNAYVGIPKIAAAVRKSPATVKRTLTKAKALGLLTVTARGHRRGDGTTGDNAYAATIPTSTAHPDGSTAHLDEPESGTSTAHLDEPESPASMAQAEASTAHQGTSMAQIGPSIGDRETTTQKAAAAANITDQQGEGDPAIRKILAGCGRHPDDRPWARAAADALTRGGLWLDIIGHVMAPIRPPRDGTPIRSEEAIRLERLRRWAGKPAEEAHETLYASVAAQPTPQPDPPPPRDYPLCPEHGDASRYTPAGKCAMCLVRDHPELDPADARMPGKLDPGARAALKRTLDEAGRNIRR